MTKEDKIKLLASCLGQPYLKGDEAVFFCPRHAHRKRKLCVNIVTEQFHCWVCDFRGGRLTPILRQYGTREQLDRYLAASGKVVERKEEEFDRPELPAEFWPLSVERHSPYYENALSYVRRRGIGGDDIVRYKLGYCESGEYKNRIVLPSFTSSGELNFVVGRMFYDGPGLSYKHGKYDKDIIFNDYLVDWDQPVVLVEGPFDAYAAGQNAVPLLGNTLNPRSLLFRKIVTAGCGVAFVALDSDARARQVAVINSLISYGVVAMSVDLATFGAKDPADLGRDGFAAAKMAARPIETMGDIIKEKLACV